MNAGAETSAWSMPCALLFSHNVTSRSGAIDFDRFPIGSRVKILPNHACATAAAYDHYFVTEGGHEIHAVWKRVNGW